jgi:polysaccharide chain length determinant protein (PEP-CTERM system associated)
MVDDADDQVSRSFEELWAIVCRRRWWILLPLFACWAAIWAGSWLLPTTYESEALILVEQQKVPEQYVVPNVTVSLQDRLQSMTQQILSRTRLQATIDRFHLYYSSRRGLGGLLQSEDPVEQMRKDVKIELVRSPGRPGELTAFRVHYSAASRELAQQVNSELTSLFINENLRSQQQLSESTTSFLGNQLADARTKLEEQEAKVRAFKAKHLGDLPSQLVSNVEILSGLQTQLQNVERALDGARQQNLYLESLLQEYQATRVSLGIGDSTLTSPEALEKDLADLRHRLAADRSRYMDNHPDIVALEDKIVSTESLKKEVEDKIASNQKTSKTRTGLEPGAAAVLDRGSPTPVMQIQSQLKANELEMQNYQAREKELQSQITAYHARLNSTPEREQELADVSRGYEESKANYNSLLQKQNQSQLATSLEQRQQGEQFRILDPPSVPDKPSAPNHFLVSLSGLALGIALGFGWTAFLELTNVRVRQEKDLQGLVPARVLVSISHLSTPNEDRFRVLFRRVEFGAGVAMVILIIAGNLYAFYKG